MLRRQRSRDLLARVADEANLRAAWRSVRRKKGRDGLDGVSLQTFQANLDRKLLSMARALNQDSYRPYALRRVVVLKRDQRRRIIGVPTVADRVVQHAILNVLEPYFEPDFCPCSYGFRPGRSAQQAVHAVVESLREGLRWVVEGDLEDFFDSLEWTILRRALEEKIHDPRLITLIHRFLQAGALRAESPVSQAQGTPQGAVFSPLFANIYLDRFDRQMTAHGHRMIRYADDFLTLHRTEADAKGSLNLMREVLESHLKLRLNPLKTGLKDANHSPFDFLSFRFRIDSVAPTPQAIELFKAWVLAVIQTHKGQGGVAIAAQLNPLIRGWGGYFKIGQVADLYHQLDRWIAAEVGKISGSTRELASLAALTASRRY